MFHGARIALTILLAAGAMTLPACSISTAPPDPPTDGVNSSFTREGVREIARSGEATIDLRSGSLTAGQLGALDGKTLWDVNLPMSDPVSLTVLGPDGTLAAETGTIRVLADPDGTVRVVSYFLAFSDLDALTDRVREDAALVGISHTDLESLLHQLPRQRAFQTVLNDGNALGFQVSIAVTVDPERDGQVLQYTITPASQVAN